MKENRMWGKASDSAMIINSSQIYYYNRTLVINTPKNLVELSTIREEESLGVPRPETMNTIFFLDGSQSCSHLGSRTAIKGKNAASMTHPCLGEVAMAFDAGDSNVLSSPRNRRIDMSSTCTGV